MYLLILLLLSAVLFFSLNCFGFFSFFFWDSQGGWVCVHKCLCTFSEKPINKVLKKTYGSCNLHINVIIQHCYPGKIRVGQCRLITGHQILN